MNKKLDSRVMTSDAIEAQVLRAIMFAVFEDYILDCNIDDFVLRFGTRGLKCLNDFSKDTQ